MESGEPERIASFRAESFFLSERKKRHRVWVMRSRIENRELAPRRVLFDALECCALSHAFAKNVDTVVDKKRLKKPADILVDTNWVKFIPTDEDKLAYT